MKMSSFHMIEVVGFIAIAFGSLYARESESEKVTPITIATNDANGDTSKILCVVGTELMFFQWKSSEAPAAETPSLSLGFAIDHAFLRVKIVPPEGKRKTDFPKDLLAKDGWYVTADYSTKTPHVILAEKPTKYSKWTIHNIPVARGQDHHHYFQNQNDSRKDVWLSMEARGRKYVDGIARMPILSAERNYFFVIEAYDPDGSR